MSSRRFAVEIFILSQKASQCGCEESGKLDLEVLVVRKSNLPHALVLS